jgi:cupin superfamily acireductone dioxygenase involved in methionine salvage
MTNEEMQKTMQFILEHQAQFAANQQQTDERVSRLETNMAEMAREVSQVTREVGEVTRAQAHMNEVVAAMLDAHKHTEERLDAFIGVLERYISEDRNGKGGGGDAA